MDSEKKEGALVSFNLSPSSLNMYYQSPLLFYLTYIEKVPDDTPVPVCYGLSGSIVHDCLEKYAKQELDRDETCAFLATQWLKYKLDVHKDLKGETLNQTQYLIAMLKGMHIVDAHEAPICEEKITLPFKKTENMHINIKGIIDLQATHKHNKQQVIIDYKTSNSVNGGKEFERQALFYNLLIHKKKGIIPSQTTFHYLKLGLPKNYHFQKDDILAFEEELQAVAEEITSFGNHIENYSIGDVDGIFNSKKQACLQEIAKRNSPALTPQHAQTHF